MPINEYTAGLQYERLIVRAFNGSRGGREAKAGYFQNLYKAERGEFRDLDAESYREQFEDIRNYLKGAVKRLQQNGLDTAEFIDIEERINTCSTANCLAKQIKYALTLLASRE